MYPETKEEKKFYKEYCQLIRIALTGNTFGPDLYKLMGILGKDKCISRLNNFVKKLEINSKKL